MSTLSGSHIILLYLTPALLIIESIHHTLTIAAAFYCILVVVFLFISSHPSIQVAHSQHDKRKVPNSSSLEYLAS